ncbi:MAG TPA: hypothetical protein VEZ90_00625 [Blastocatellia bacterium]|nr:hypothetical protein [Blastocatellia bacterium]
MSTRTRSYIRDLEILAVVQAFQVERPCATAVAQILHVGPGTIVAPVRDLIRQGLLEAEDPERVKRRKSGLRQALRITAEGRLTLNKCDASTLIDAANEEMPLEDLLRLCLVTVLIFGSAGFSVIGLAERKNSASQKSPKKNGTVALPAAGSKHLESAFRNLAELANEGRALSGKWERSKLGELSVEVQVGFPLALEALKQIERGGKPDTVLRQLRRQEEEKEEEERRRRGEIY